MLGETPFTADLEMTQAVKQTRAPLDITLRDRLIIGVLDVFSLHSAGLVPDPRRTSSMATQESLAR